jgi:hypothetical protein
VTKRDTIIELLRRYRDAECTLERSTGTGDGAAPLMPACWNESFRELERCLHVLSGERPKQARQLLARYVDPQISRRRLIGKRGKDEAVTFKDVPTHSEVLSYAKLPDSDRAANEWDVVLASWPRWVRTPLVESALDRIEALFKGEPYLPQEMLRAA